MMKITAAFRALWWFIYQAVTVGGIGATYFLVPFVIIASLIVWGVLKTNPEQKRLLRSSLLALPLFWIFIGMWAGFFWNNRPGHIPVTPAWVGYVPTIAAGAFLITAGFFVWKSASVRLIVLGYALINFYFILANWFLAIMAISGDWL
ncbi:MAG TPA: hypothetical protein VNW15_16655 [Rhizomicrobium sp.]|jgi:hypothetical protein|nr:hypothetical protein [Rhizomicrobium sp.]